MAARGKSGTKGGEAGGGGLLVPLIAVTVIAGAAGGGFGVFLGHPRGGAEKPGHAVEKPAAEPAAPVVLQAVPPILTNLAGAGKALIRLEVKLALNPDTPNTDALAAKIGEDFVAYLRTVTLPQIEGPSGFLYLREDLIDRARIRSEGQVRDVIILSFAVE